MKNLEKMFRYRDMSLPRKMQNHAGNDFPVISNESEMWTLKNQDGKSIDTFELCCWRKHF